MMHDSIQIRPAQPADAEVAAVLLYSAYTHNQLAYPLQDVRESGWIERLACYFGQTSNRFSYQNTQVATLDGAVVGLVLSFGGRDEAQLNADVGGWLEREAADDEWYVDALAVFTDWGRKGIGARLLQATEQLARQRHYPNIGLHVAPENQPALALYARLKYVTAENTILYGRPYIHMVKTLSL